MTSTRRLSTHKRVRPNRDKRLILIRAVLAVTALGIVVIGAIWLLGRGIGASPEGPATLSQLRTVDFHSLAFSPADGNVLLYGHHGGIMISRDGGRTWNKTNLSGAGDDAMGIGFSVAEPDQVFAAGHNTFFSSNDGGQSWTPAIVNLPSRDIHALTVSVDEQPVIFANVGGVGLARSADGGKSWTQPASSGLPADVIQLAAGKDGVLYAASPRSGIVRSDDDGNSFAPTGPLNAAALALAASATDANTIYAGTDAGLFVSTNAGKSWTQRQVPVGSQVLAVTVSAGDPRDVAILSVDGEGVGHVSRSPDGGATWTRK